MMKRKMRNLIIIVAALLISLIQIQAATLGTVSVSSTPSEVSSSATLDFLITPITPIPVNGSVVITLPDTTSIAQGVLT